MTGNRETQKNKQCKDSASCGRLILFSVVHCVFQVASHCMEGLECVFVLLNSVGFSHLHGRFFKRNLFIYI